jgi:hypothetical protein
MKEIYKKVLPEYYEAVKDGLMPFEIRKDDDCVEIGDILILQEWTGEEFTGYAIKRKVTYVLRNTPQFGLKKGYCIIGLDYRDPEEYKNPDEVTVEELIDVLCRRDKNTIVHNRYEENIKVYSGKENKSRGRNILMIC